MPVAFKAVKGLTYLTIELCDGFLACFNQLVLLLSLTQDIVRCYARLSGVDTLPPHYSICSHLHVGVSQHQAGTVVKGLMNTMQDLYT